MNFTKNEIFGDNFEAVYLGQLLKGKIQTINNETILDVHTDAELGPLLGDNFAKYMSGISNVMQCLELVKKMKLINIQDCRI